MFGLSLGEIMVLLIVGIVVIGPKNLPTMMRTAGQWISKLRRLSSDLRSQSGIDDLIRHEGLEKEIQELRSLSRMNVVESLITPSVLRPVARPPSLSADGGSHPRMRDYDSVHDSDHIQPLREREYPLAGCDAAGALNDDAVIYHHPPIEADPADTTSSTLAAASTDDAADAPGGESIGAAAPRPEAMDKATGASA